MNRTFRSYLVLISVIFLASCADNKISDPEYIYLVDAQSTGSLSSAELRTAYAASPQLANLASSTVDSWRVVYNTLDPQGNEIQASGLVIVPRRATPSVLSLHRGTTFMKTEAPSLFSPATLSSNAGWQYLAPLIGSFGYIVAMPDLIGYGATSSSEHPFFITNSDARASIDFLNAVKELLEREEVISSGRLFLTGYSQGGSTVMAILKAVQQGEVLPFNLVAATSGGGAYDLNAIANHLLQEETIAGAAHISFLLTSYLRTYFPERPLNTVFTETYANRIAAENLFGGTLSFDQITARLNGKINELFREDFIQAMLGDGEAQLKAKLRENSLHEVAASIPLRIYHGDADEIIPIEPTRAGIQKLIRAGSSSLTFIEVQGGTHFTTALEFGGASLTWFAFQ
jgi:pimeloyl-ACP methyl ester carboxylesterase